MHTLTTPCEVSTRDEDGGSWTVAHEFGETWIHHTPAGGWKSEAIAVPPDVLAWLRDALGRVSE